MSWARATRYAQRAWLRTFHDAGVTVTYTPGGGTPAAFTFARWYFRDQHEQVDLATNVHVGMRMPELHVLEDDLVAAGMTAGADDVDTLTDRVDIDGQLYGITEARPDGRGIVVLFLVEADS